MALEDDVQALSVLLAELIDVLRRFLDDPPVPADEPAPEPAATAPEQSSPAPRRPNPYETQGRARKAVRLAEAFKSHTERIAPTITHAELVAAAHACTPELWRELAEVAGINPPSAETIDATIGVLEAVPGRRDLSEEEVFRNL